MADSVKWRRIAKAELAKVREWDVQAERGITVYLDMLEAKLPVAELEKLRLTEMEATMRADAYREVLKEVQDLLSDMLKRDWDEIITECKRRIDEVLKDT